MQRQLLVTERRQNKKLWERRVPGNLVSDIRKQSRKITECDSCFSEPIERFLQCIVCVVLLVTAGAAGDAEHVQGEEEDGPYHAELAGQEWGRECYIPICR